MKKDFFALIIALMIIALLGIISIQVFWLNNAIDIKQAQTDSAINEALSQVVDQVETKETVTVITDNVCIADSMIHKVVSNEGDKLGTKSKKTQISINSIEEIDELGDEIEAFVEELTGQLNFKIDIQTDNASGSKDENFEISSADKALVISKQDENFSIKINKLIKSKQDQVDMVVKQLITEDLLLDKPLEQRIDTLVLVDDVKQALKNKGLKYDFDIAVIDEKNDSILFADAKSIQELRKTKYKTDLFPNDILDKDIVLYLGIEDASAEVYKSVMLPLLGSGLFSLIILVVFIVTLVTIHKQKKLSEIKSDFINNMTHEFKTPIATISLATDSIENEKVISDAKQIRYFTKIIKEENNRMNYQVENVLQASLLDKDDFDLYMVDSDVKPLIHKAINNIQMQVEKRDGRISLELNAENHKIKVDEIHFVNVINNLLDNANKYSESAPQIAVKTFNKDGFLIISVTDNGIGMTKEVKSKIFEKFYRQTHGNVHNVKGFGLGLSYVWVIISKFKGEVFVESKLGAGSTFSLEFPLIKNA